MKRIVLLLFTVSLVIGGCTSSKKLYERGLYDPAIRKAVARLKKKPDRSKEIVVLQNALRNANQIDLDRITFLKQTGQPDIWDEVFDCYDRLKRRQDIVKTLPTSILTEIGFVPVDYDKDIIEAQKKAAEYFYQHAVSLLNKNEKFSARMAYEDLLSVKKYYATYKDVDDLISRAIKLGTTNVIFVMDNQSMAILPQGFEDELLKISLKDLNTKWINYDAYINQSTNYDYSIYLNLKVIDVSPERIKEKQYTEFKEVQDGWQYVLDGNGNVMKDSLGNDIKVPKYKTISCTVVETQMNKNAIVTGSVDFFDNASSQLMKTENLSAEAVFNYLYAVAHGDINALSSETSKKLSKPMPFPNDLEMIMMANDRIKEATKSIIWNNQHLIK